MAEMKEEMTPYEQQRMDNIRRNEAEMMRLGLACLSKSNDSLTRMMNGRLEARRKNEKAFAQSERACVGGLCEVSPPAVLVRRQPFIGPVGQGCRTRRHYLGEE